jgi:outer membrane PBP1 activator LpoA protein
MDSATRWRIPATRPELAIYDTSTAVIGDLLTQARSDGSDFIVSPLTRRNRRRGLRPPLAPTLALNFLANERAAPASFYQYRSRPRQSRAVARACSPAANGKAWHWLLATGQPGVGRIPRGTAGRRRRAGTGQLRSTAHAWCAVKVASAPSTAGPGRRLQTLLDGRIRTAPARRYQFIFAAGMSTMRACCMQLRFNYASTVPIYATSDAYTPQWAIPTAILTCSSRHAQVLPEGSIDTARWRAAGGVSAAWRSRLFAFGYDACQLSVAIAGARVIAACRWRQQAH